MKLILTLVVSAAAFAQSRDSIEKQLRSVAQQRESIRKMMPLAAAAPACEPMPDEQVSPILESAARKRELPVKLLRAVAEQESGLRPCAVSEKGAQGLMQLMPATAEQYQVQDPFDPKENVEAGAAFLRALVEKYKGDLPLALAAYNAGPEMVDQISAVPDIPETRAYIDAIVEKVGNKKIELHP
jgi:soluble lytic murein transglycosylase-like protein